MWPQQVAYMEDHRSADKQLRALQGMIPVVGDEDGLEKFILHFFEWDAQNSLTPAHIEVHEHRDPEVTNRNRVGR